MRFDPSDLIAALLSLAALTLAIPKRDWRSIPQRLRLTHAGLRLHVFGPPPWERFGVLWHVFEHGVPLMLAAWYAEHRGMMARAERELDRRESKPGLVFRHLCDEMTEEELHARLRARSYLLPASRLELPRPHRLLMPPAEWRSEWDRRLKEMEAEAAAPPPSQAAAAPTAQIARTEVVSAPSSRSEARVEIHTLGEVRILIDGTDLAPQLLHARALAFTVLYLLSWEVRRPGDRMTREFMGEETFNGQDPAMRRTGVSTRLANLKRRFPELRNRIVTDGEYLGFDTTGCEVDVLRVFSIAEGMRVAGAHPTDELVGDARDAAELAAREYLPGWERIESGGTLGGSAASDVVADVRDRVVGARLDILGGLAEAALAGRRLDEAAAHLEKALHMRPERLDVARRLAEVHEMSGRRGRAAELRAEYGIDEAW